MIELEINYSKTSEKFVLKNKSIISFKKIRELLEKGIRKLNNQNVNIDVKELKGKLQGLYRIRNNYLNADSKKNPVTDNNKFKYGNYQI